VDETWFPQRGKAGRGALGRKIKVSSTRAVWPAREDVVRRSHGQINGAAVNAIGRPHPERDPRARMPLMIRTTTSWITSATSSRRDSQEVRTRKGLRRPARGATSGPVHNLIERREFKSKADLKRQAVGVEVEIADGRVLFQQLGANGVPLGVPTCSVAADRPHQRCYGSPLSKMALPWYKQGQVHDKLHISQGDRRHRGAKKRFR